MLSDDDDAVAVLLPDDLVMPDGILTRMAQVRKRYGGSVLSACDVPGERISAYGVFDVQPTDTPNVHQVIGMVEKPTVAEAPSSLGAIGRYVLDRAIFDAIRRIKPGSGGELQLTDAVALLIDEGHPVHVVVHEGPRHDLGNPAGLLKAAVDMALDRPDYGPELRQWLLERLGNS
jgi:UTP--glucose-1-phosphate uridylyltransferase